MKVLNNEQQTELRELLESLEGFGADVQAQINYWAIELKPKRVRKNNKVFNEVVSGLEDAIKIGKFIEGVDKPVE